MQISTVLRGEDHLSNTPKQIAMFRALEESPPEYAHVPLIHSPKGGKLKKRELGEGLGWVWENCYLSEAMFNYLALLGWSHPEGKEILTKEETVSAFAIDRISRSPSKFDINKLDWLNEQHMRMLDPDSLYNAAMEFLPVDQFKALDDELGRDRFKTAMFELNDGYSNLKEIPEKFTVFQDEHFREGLTENSEILMSNKEKNIDLLAAFLDEVKAADNIPDGETAVHIMKSTGGKANCKGKDLYHPLRVTLTGRTEGFELKRLLPLMGKDRVLKRAEYALGILKQSEV
jgi:nondiscriminating glutamyl-tRNA synthetase